MYFKTYIFLFLIVLSTTFTSTLLARGGFRGGGDFRGGEGFRGGDFRRDYYRGGWGGDYYRGYGRSYAPGAAWMAGRGLYWDNEGNEVYDYPQDDSGYYNQQQYDEPENYYYYYQPQ